MNQRKKICLTCQRLGKCNDVTLEMLQNQRGCGSWFAAHPKEVEARLRAIDVAGYRTLEALIMESPPKKPAKEYRR